MKARTDDEKTAPLQLLNLLKKAQMTSQAFMS